VIELLAPAGSREAFTAALEGGANAIYLGGRAFGARHYAPNFTDEELAEVVREAHLRDAAVYVTVNTLIDNSEIPLLVSYLRHLYTIGVDAIIVQDIGVAQIAREVVPNLPLHASTQMTVYNLAGVEYLAKMGFTRVVLARELTLEEIRTICQKSPVEIETFIHGALCISYSGQCLMSSMIGGRSGNRGRCAQPCRLPYTLVNSEGKDALAGEEAGEYLLSPRDFSTIGLLPELIEAGVVSFKIEGRMKRPEYVAVVVDTYRRAIDAYLADKNNYVIDPQDEKDMAQIFNRGFTTAYLERKQGRNMMSDRRPNNRGVRVGRVLEYNHQERSARIKLDEPLNTGDIIEFWIKVGGRTSATISKMLLDGREVANAPAGAAVTIGVPTPVKVGDRVFKTFDVALMDKARGFFSSASAVRRVPVDALVEVAEGLPLVITFRDDDGNVGQGKTAFIAEKAVKRPLDETVIAKQAGRLGTTVFGLRSLDCRIKGEVMVPISEINEARRAAMEALEQARLSRFARPPLNESPAVNFVADKKRAAPNRQPLLTVNADTVAKVEAALQNGADVIMFGGERLDHRPITADDFRQVVGLVRRQGKQVLLSTPRIIKDGQLDHVRAKLDLFSTLKPDGVSAANLGTLKILQDYPDFPVYGDYPLNIYNSVAIDFFSRQGLVGLTLSPELNFEQLGQLTGRSAVSLECLVQGYLTLMISEYCVVGSFRGGLHTGKCNQACLNGQYWLKDRKNELFRVRTDQFCRMHILNAKELSMLPHVPKFGALGIDRIRIEGKAADIDELARMTLLYRELLDNGENHPLFKGDGFAAVEHEDITRGHYFRGVL
jgi:putative protease